MPRSGVRPRSPARRPAALVLAGAALALAACSGGSDGRPIIGLITKTDTNPFFVTMKKGAQAQAEQDGIDLRTFAGKVDGDNESQVTAIENLMALGAEGFMITPNDSRAIVPAIDRAKEAGLAVIALDSQLDPPGAADSTFATDNYRAGELVGQWAKAKLGDEAANARIAFLDLNSDQVSVDVQRDQGFMAGFGIDVGDPNRIGDEDDPRISGHDVTDGAADGGRTAMENLLQRDPDINLVYAINEPAAAGGYQALRAAGKAEDVVVVAIDGGCPGVQSVKDGQLGATSQQYPLKMAAEGVASITEFARSGVKPANPEGQDFTDTGVTLITDDPQSGVDSEDTTFGTENCWG
ncbi:sugar ABC transporter substrate-binding protein [Kineosporia rhizophila]|uniref:sugar ABC transporter substrate-binding protein n=1 Tax=Kineosporia TaxID=49184 RepID=UPI001E4F36F6|nr:sugar ABC transporter substrate-binding protein [Kineosporia sp. NBRC 101677]MCE0534241.1 sugar ABC transporter substrate-binding protein [Kineosporia rhizophila]GLY13788.1 sugar ABC transporter [Kineosporia sp. NBRC 101677]